jgi:hypothetical protein
VAVSSVLEMRFPLSAESTSKQQHHNVQHLSINFHTASKALNVQCIESLLTNNSQLLNRQKQAKFISSNWFACMYMQVLFRVRVHAFDSISLALGIPRAVAAVPISLCIPFFSANPPQ